jgi:tRNA(adenine34) deaminase
MARQRLLGGRSKDNRLEGKIILIKAKTAEYFMSEALKEARKAALKNEVPIGAIAVHDGKIIARGHNRSIMTVDPSAHAEIVTLRKAAKKIGNYRLPEVILYVTIEPCPMCAGALVQARIKELYFGAKDPKAGACGSVFHIIPSKKLNHSIDVYQGIMKEECQDILRDFFRKKRK